jgi:hypothetical protein
LRDLDGKKAYTESRMKPKLSKEELVRVKYRKKGKRNDPTRL